MDARNNGVYFHRPDSGDPDTHWRDAGFSLFSLHCNGVKIIGHWLIEANSKEDAIRKADAFIAECIRKKTFVYIIPHEEAHEFSTVELCQFTNGICQ